MRRSGSVRRLAPAQHLPTTYECADQLHTQCPRVRLIEQQGRDQGALFGECECGLVEFVVRCTAGFRGEAKFARQRGMRAQLFEKLMNRNMENLCQVLLHDGPGSTNE